MDDMNHCNVIGRLTRDVEVKKLRSGPVGNMTIAINREIRRQDREPEQRVTFVDAVLWGIPDKLVQYLTKGRQLAIHGEISTSSWERDGQQYHKTFITIRELQLLSEPQGPKGRKKIPQSEAEHKQEGSRQRSEWRGPGPEQFDDDIPF